MNSFQNGAFQSAPKCQEFVIEATNELVEWVLDKIES